MRTTTFSKTRIFRTDPELDAAVAASAAREGVNVSEFLRSAIRKAVAPPSPPTYPRPSGAARASAHG